MAGTVSNLYAHNNQILNKLSYVFSYCPKSIENDAGNIFCHDLFKKAVAIITANMWNNFKYLTIFEHVK